jgi:hypothetical protein
MVTNPFIINDGSACDGFCSGGNPIPTVMALLIGTSGWNYPTGKGHVERSLLSRDALEANGTRDFDELRFYAEHFDTVEVNSTFYGQPRAEGHSHMGRAGRGPGSTSR